MNTEAHHVALKRNFYASIFKAKKYASKKTVCSTIPHLLRCFTVVYLIVVCLYTLRKLSLNSIISTPKAKVQHRIIGIIALEISTFTWKRLFRSIKRAQLVPVFAFGENDLLQQAKYPYLRSLQERFRKFSGIAPVMFYGRGVFQYDYGLLPYRVPLFIVVGKPIDVKKTEKPTQEDIDELHGKYIEALTKLYNDNKHAYAKNPDVELKII